MSTVGDTTVSFRDELQRITAGRVRMQEPLKRHSTFRIGGPAEFYVAPQSAREVADVLALSRAEAVPVHVLGNGSNLVIADAGVRGLVLHVSRRLGGMRTEGLEVSAGAGLPLTQLMQYASRQGLTGLEWACGIPGTVGGALFTNAGTPAGQMSDRLVRIEVVEADGTPHSL